MSPRVRPPRPRGVHRSLLRHLRPAGLLAVGALVGALAGVVVPRLGRSELAPWHRVAPAGELSARSAPQIAELSDLEALEGRLFEETRRLLEPSDGAGPPPWSRFRTEGPTSPDRTVTDWNRSVLLSPTGPPLGVALLLHGLSDAPYSLRTTGQLLAGLGYRTLLLRLPGHGTTPAALRDVGVEEWRAAVRLGVRLVCQGLDPEAPLLVAGYSNGAALALDYTLDSLDDEGLRRPARLVLLSPAFAVTPAAAWGWTLDLLARLPGLQPLAWNSVAPEIEPFKYASFPVHAGVAVHRLTARLERRMAHLEVEDRIAELPPVLTIQSVVDATVPPTASLSRVYGRILDPESELVLFDANRSAAIAGLFDPKAFALLDLADPDRPFPFAVTLVTNRAPSTAEVEARSREAGSREVTRRPLGLAWPPGFHSLSHVAIPFPPDDPVYGASSPLPPPFPLGELEVRGERHATLLSPTSLGRARYNPFHTYVQERITRFVAREGPRQEHHPRVPLRESPGPRAGSVHGDGR